MHVGVDDRADRQRGVERLAVGGERQDHRPRPERRPRSHTRRTSTRSSRVSLRPATSQRSVSGAEASTSALRTCHPHATATPSASSLGSCRTRWPAWASRCRTPISASTVLVPVGFGADPPGEPADAVGEGAGAGVGEPAGQLVPRGEAGDARVGEARRAGDPRASGRARRARRRAARRARCARTSPGSATGSGDGAGRDSSSSRAARPAGASPTAAPASSLLGPPALLAIDPAGDGAGSVTAGDVAAHPQHEQGDDVLARVGTARARAPSADIDVVDGHVVGLGARAVVAPPHALVRSAPVRDQRAGTATASPAPNRADEPANGDDLLDRPHVPRVVIRHDGDVTEALSQRGRGRARAG